MCKLITFILSLWLSLSAVAFAAADDVPLLKNGDFAALDEQGLPMGWDFKGAAAHEIAVDKDADGNALKVTVRKQDSARGLIQAPQVSHVKPNTRYRLSCDLKSNAPNMGYVQVKLYQGNNEIAFYETERSRRDWSSESVTFDTADSDRIAVFLRFRQDKISQRHSAWFRKVKLVETNNASAKSQTPPTIRLIGDSTVCDYPASSHPQMGWGQALPDLCKPGVQVRNHAVGSHSSRSFHGSYWKAVLRLLRPNDYVMIQFGHNDQHQHRPKIYAAADSLYREMLKAYIAETRARSAHPILVTPVCRRLYEEGRIRNSLSEYAEAMKAVAAETKTPLIDLNAISATQFNEIGPEGTKAIFMHLRPGQYKNDRFRKGREDNTHFQEAGAKILADWIVSEARKQSLPLAKLFQ